jgi:hypothetical protein
MEKRKIDCEMNLIAESSIDGLKVFMYEIKSQLGEIFIIEHEQKDKQLVTEFKTDRTEAEKLYKKQIKKMLAEN